MYSDDTAYVCSFALSRLYVFCIFSLSDIICESRHSIPSVKNRSTKFQDLDSQRPQRSSYGSAVFMNSGNIASIVKGEKWGSNPLVDMQHPVYKRRTDGPACRLAKPIADGWTMMTNMRRPPSPCPREGEMGLIFRVMAHHGQLLGCVVSTVLRT